MLPSTKDYFKNAQNKNESRIDFDALTKKVSQLPKSVERVPETTDRTWGEAAADTGIGLLEGAVDVARLPYTAGDIVSGGALERSTGFGKDNFERTINILEDLKSDPLKRKEADISATEGFYLLWVNM